MKIKYYAITFIAADWVNFCTAETTTNKTSQFYSGHCGDIHLENWAGQIALGKVLKIMSPNTIQFLSDDTGQVIKITLPGIEPISPSRKKITKQQNTSQQQHLINTATLYYLTMKVKNFSKALQQ